MGRTGIFVVGPAGSGKSTFCFTLQNHLLSNSSRLKPKLINLDPGQERTEAVEASYPFDFDVRDLISVQDVMEELGYGPNGALVFCMEHLAQNLQFLEEGLDEIGGSDDEYFIFDSPGQIELYTHIPVLSRIIGALKSFNINVCVVHVIDALFIDDTSKFISGALLSLTSMMQLRAPAINVITKCDLKKKNKMGGRLRNVQGLPANLISRYVPFTNNDMAVARDFSGSAEHATEKTLAISEDLDDQDGLARDFIENHGGDHKDARHDQSDFLDVQDLDFFNPDILTLRESVAEQSSTEMFVNLSDSICTILENYNLVSFLPLDITDTDSVDLIVMHLDNATQYGEDLEPRDPGNDDGGYEE